MAGPDDALTRYLNNQAGSPPPTVPGSNAFSGISNPPNINDILGSFGSYNVNTSPPLSGSAGNPQGNTPYTPGSGGYPGNLAGVDPSILPSSLTVWTGAAPDAQSLILNNPQYKQQLEWLDQANGLTNQGFDIAGQRIASGYNVSHAGVDAADAGAALNTSEAAHQHTQNQQQIRESLASRGMLAQNGDPFAAGQNVTAQGEEDYNYGDALQRIQLSVQQAHAAYDDAVTQAANAKSLAELDLALNKAQAAQQYAQNKGQALMSTASSLQQSGAFNRPATEAMWVPSAGAYQTMDGQWWAMDSSGNAVSIAAPGQQAAVASPPVPAAPPPAAAPPPLPAPAPSSSPAPQYSPRGGAFLPS